MVLNNKHHLFCPWIYNLSRVWQRTVILATFSIRRSSSTCGLEDQLPRWLLTWLASWCCLLAGSAAGAKVWESPFSSMWAFHVVWVSSPHGGCMPRASIMTERVRRKHYSVLWLGLIKEYHVHSILFAKSKSLRSVYIQPTSKGKRN